MSTIVVGADFSDGSHLAVNLAVDVAQHWGHDVQMVGVRPDGCSTQQVKDQIADLSRRFDDIADKIKIDSLLCEGNVVDAICRQASAVNATLVIVGSHAVTGFKKRLGRDTYELVAKSPVPVLTIRQDFVFHPQFKNILLPIDNNPYSRQKLPMAIRFAKSYGSTLHLLGLCESWRSELNTIVRNYTRQAKSYLDSLNIPCTVDCVEATSKVPSVALSYAESVNADMVMLMNDMNTSLTRFLAGTNEERTLTESRIPVLSMRPEQLHTIHSF